MKKGQMILELENLRRLIWFDKKLSKHKKDLCLKLITDVDYYVREYGMV